MTKFGGLDISVTTQPGGITIRLEGELDIVSSGSLRDQLISSISEGPDEIRLDLAGIEFIDSSGLGVLVGALKRRQQTGGDLRLVNVPPRVNKLLEISGLTKVFTIDQ